MVKMKNVCNDRLADNPKLIKAAKLEAEKHLLPSNLTPTLKTTKGKPYPLNSRSSPRNQDIFLLLKVLVLSQKGRMMKI